MTTAGASVEPSTQEKTHRTPSRARHHARRRADIPSKKEERMRSSFCSVGTAFLKKEVYSRLDEEPGTSSPPTGGKTPKRGGTHLVGRDAMFLLRGHTQVFGESSVAGSARSRRVTVVPLPGTLLME